MAERSSTYSIYYKLRRERDEAAVVAFRRRLLDHVVEALLQHRASPSERPVHAPRERASTLFMPFASLALPPAATIRCTWSAWIE